MENLVYNLYDLKFETREGTATFPKNSLWQIMNDEKKAPFIHITQVSGRSSMMLNTTLTNMIRINAKKAQNQKNYKTEYGKIALELEEVQKKYDKIKSKIEFKNAGAVKIRTYINEIKKATKLVKDFDDVMFMSFIDKVLVFKNKITFTWKNGTQTEVQNG